MGALSSHLDLLAHLVRIVAVDVEDILDAKFGRALGADSPAWHLVADLSASCGDRSEYHSPSDGLSLVGTPSRRCTATLRSVACNVDHRGHVMAHRERQTHAMELVTNSVRRSATAKSDQTQKFA